MTEPPDLESMARHIVAALGPLVTAAKGLTAADGDFLECQQVWCPVCAALALSAGKGHPLVTLLVEHASSLLTLLNAAATPNAGPAAEPRDDGSGSRPGRYESIPVTIHDA